MQYQPTNTERLIAIGLAAAIAAFIMALIWRNEPISDGNLVVALRIILSLMAGLLGSLMTGFLNVDYSGGGLAIRAGAGFALAVMTYFGTPQVLPALNTPTEVQLARFQGGDVGTAILGINSYWMQPENIARWKNSSLEDREEQVRDWLGLSNSAKNFNLILQYMSDQHHCISTDRCDGNVLCPVIFTELDNFFMFFRVTIESWASVGYGAIANGAGNLLFCDCVDQLRQARCENHPSMCDAKPDCPEASA